MSYLKKNFEVLSLEWYGPKADWSEASVIKAHDYEDAASTWAEETDQQGDYTIISRGEHGPILVREEGSETHKTVYVTAEAVPHYYARVK